MGRCGSASTSMECDPAAASNISEIDAKFKGTASASGMDAGGCGGGGGGGGIKVGSDDACTGMSGAGAIDAGSHAGIDSDDAGNTDTGTSGAG